MAFSTINKGSSFFSPVLYTGNTSSGTTISSLDFAPDMVWFKSRTQTENHQIYDAVRGVTERIIPNGDQAEATASTGLTNFDSNGFRTGGENETDNGNIVAWNWKAGTTSVPSGGSITPSAVSINTTSGFGIYAYAGVSGSSATIAHGLGVAPELVIAKKTSGTGDWPVYAKPVGATKYQHLNSTAEPVDNDNRWYDTDPTSTLITVGDYETNESGGSHIFIMYAFASISGYSKVGSYKGNGNADGTFIYTGFKPSFMICKKTNGADDWRILTENVNTRNTATNEVNKNLYAQTNAAESGTSIDFVSNGMKIYSTSGGINGSADDYIYIAFGQPIISNSGICATAR